MTRYQIIQNDVIEWAKSYSGPKFHCIFADPPYHLTSITKRFGGPNSAPAKGDVYKRASAGFMSQQWDGGDLAFNPKTWEALAEHLYPGGFGMAFASSRGWHRMAVAIEDASLIIHPSIFLWNYLSGFPKATRIKGYGSPTFKGHRYGLQALKPAAEPIIVFQKPYEGRPADSIAVTGAGALWIDGGRIETNEAWEGRLTGKGEAVTVYGDGLNNRSSSSHPNGRWPANFVLSHSPNCNGECVPDCPIRLFDEQAGNRAGGSPKTGLEPSEVHKNVYGKRNRVAFAGYEDDGPASRMFYRADFSYEVAEQLANAEPVRYEPKSSTAEREAGLEDLETRTRHRVNPGGLENEPRFAPTQVKNNHPCVKPISLIKYLCTLLAPPAAYAPRRILIPFAGSGSEICGAILSGGFEEIIGIEREASYVKIAQARCEWWSQWPGWGQTDVDAILQADKGKEQQMSFLDAA